MRALAQRPAFYKSPIWQSKSRDYIGIARELGMKVDRKLVAQAIVNSWDGQSFAEKLRELPSYLSSNEFKTNEAAIANIYRSIFGEPDEQNTLAIKEMALGRWKPDQAAAAFRADPNYRNSAEYRSKVYELSAALGFLPTQQAPAPSTGAPTQRVPNSPRIPGDPNNPGSPPANRPPTNRPSPKKPAPKKPPAKKPAVPY
jgi:hypothetical protein